MAKVKETFGMAAGRAVAQAAPPAPPSTNCVAHGCILPAGIIRDGQRFCCVHLDVPSYDQFDAATAEIRKRQGLVMAINLLRSPGDLFPDAKVMDHACQLAPELSRDAPNPYSLLLEAEHRMRKHAMPIGAQGWRPPPGAVEELLRGFKIKRMPR